MNDDRAFWNAEAERYDRDRREDITYHSCLDACRRDVAPIEDGTLLEAGVGTGLLTRRLAIDHPRATIVALDYSLESLRLLQRKLTLLQIVNVQCVCGDLTALPFTDASFDTVVCANTLQHFDSDGQVTCLRELNRSLGAGRPLVCSVHHYGAAKRRGGWSKVSHSFRGCELYTFRFTADEFRHVLEQSGFEVLRIRGVGHWAPRLVRACHLLRAWYWLDTMVLNRSARFLASGHMLLGQARAA